MTWFCDFCIHILQYWSSDYHDYATWNIVLFVIAQPALILLFMFSTIHCSKTKNEKAKKIWRRITWGTLIAWTIFMIIYIGKPVLQDPVVINDIKQCRGLE